MRALSLLCLLAALAPLAAGRVGDTWGTNIHWTQGLPGETVMLARAFKVARMDFSWSAIESTCGVYDFSAYDGLLAEMEEHGEAPPRPANLLPCWVALWHAPQRPTPTSPSPRRRAPLLDCGLQ